MTHPSEQPYSETTFDRDTPTPMEDDTDGLFDEPCDCEECAMRRADEADEWEIKD